MTMAMKMLIKEQHTVFVLLRACVVCTCACMNTGTMSVTSNNSYINAFSEWGTYNTKGTSNYFK